MPQMAPMWWLSLSVEFNIIMMMTISMIYFTKKFHTKNNKKTEKSSMSWKW
uniref:ATP synthase F0 subunit 8 n=1 Tax=Dryodurgades tortilis TaxID=2172466 RepID=UPI003002BC8F|nr:ATP synthase F0 subunit 8 [Dryodurgades tortilis]